MVVVVLIIVSLLNCSTNKLPSTNKFLPIFTLLFNDKSPSTNNLSDTVKSFVTVAWSENVAAPVTPNVPPTVAASDNVVTPVTPNVPATEVFPVDAATANLSVLTAISLAIPPFANNLFVIVKSFANVEWSEKDAAPVTPNVPPTVAASPIVVTPVTPNVPATVVSPDDAATVNLFVFTAKSPVTPNVEPIVVAPVTANVPPSVESAFTDNAVPVALLNVNEPAISASLFASILPVITAVPPTDKSPPKDAPAVATIAYTPVPFAFDNVNVSVTEAVLLTVNAPVTSVVPDTVASPEIFVVPLNVVVPPTFNVPAITVLPVPSETVNLSVSLVKPPEMANAPVTFVGPVTLSVPPTDTLFDNVVAFVTESVFPITTPPTTDNPVPPTLLNVNVSLMSAAALISTEPFKVVAPVTANVSAIATGFAKSASPATFKVPPTIVLPVLSPTLNLSESIVTPPFNDTAPVNTDAPFTFNEPNVAALVTAKLPPTAASETTDRPFPVTLLSVNVSAISAVVFKSNAPDIVVTPEIFTVPNVLVPVTPNVPPTNVFPVLSATTKLLFSVDNPPFTTKSPPTVDDPDTSNIPPTFTLLPNTASPKTPNVPAIEVFPVVSAITNLSPSLVKPLDKANAPDTFTFSKFVVPLTVAPVNVVTPDTSNVPTKVVLLCCVAPVVEILPSIFTFVNVETPDTSNVVDTFVAANSDTPDTVNESTCVWAKSDIPETVSDAISVTAKFDFPDTWTVLFNETSPAIFILPFALKSDTVVFPTTVNVSLSVDEPATVNVLLRDDAPSTLRTPFTLASTTVVFPDTSNAPDKAASESVVAPTTVNFWFKLASPLKNKLELKETSPSIKRRLFIDTSFIKSTSVTTSPLIADEGILLSLNDTALNDAVPLNEASPTTSKRPPMDTSLTTNNLLFMLISFEKSTSAFTPPSIADDGILPATKFTAVVGTLSAPKLTAELEILPSLKVTLSLNDTSLNAACPLKLASFPTNILSGKETSAKNWP